MKRPVRKLSLGLEHHVSAYALAASAAGVGMLALAQPSEAKIVYTRTHKVIGSNGVYSLDLNHDEVIDFLILEAGPTYQSNNGLFVKEAFGNAVRGYPGGGTWINFASALKRGARIGPVTGPRERFVSGGYYGEGLVSFFVTDGGSVTSGQWRNVTNRYLGLRFKIDGETHYGWARLSVQLNRPLITATLTGYAFETVPDKSIRAGQTGGKVGRSDSGEHSANFIGRRSRTASLGLLALGAQGVPLARRK